MRRIRLMVFVAAFFLGFGPWAVGQEQRPGRYKLPPQMRGAVLDQIWGYPEQLPSGDHTSAFSPNGKFALYASGGGTDGDGATDDSYLTLWDVGAARVVAEVAIARSAVTAAALSADAKTALTGLAKIDGKGNQSFELVLWDLVAGKRVRSIVEPKGAFVVIALNADGKMALTSNGLGQVKVWEVDALKERATIKTPENVPVLSLAFVSGNKALVGLNNDLLLWDLAAAKELHTLKGHQSIVMSLAISADGKRAVSAGTDVSIRLWDLETGKELGALIKEPTNSSFISVAFADAGKQVIAVWTGFDAATGTQSQCDICLWNGEAKKEVWTRKGHLKGLTPIHVDDGGKHAIVGGGANPFTRIDLGNGKEERLWGGPKAPVSAIVVTPQGSIISAGQDGMLVFWEKGTPTRTLRAHADAINALALSKDGQFLISASADKTLKMWDLQTGLVRKTFIGHAGNVTSVAFSPDFKCIVSGSNDRSVKIWDILKAKEIATLTGHAEGVNAVALAADATWIASGSDDNSIRLWPLKDGQLDADRDAEVLDGHTRQVTALDFAPDGKTLLSGSQDKTVKVWDLAKLKAIKTLTGHKNWISSVGFFEESRLAYSTGDDLTVRFWDLSKGDETASIDLGNNSDCPRCLAKLRDPDGAFVVGTSGWLLLKCRLKR